MNKNVFIQDTHILLSEYVCPHCGLLPVGFYDSDGDIGLGFACLFRGFEAIREARGGRPLTITSGYRCLEHEKKMFVDYVRNGMTGSPKALCSPHLFGLALDITPESVADRDLILKLARQQKPKPRIGWKQYQDAGELLIHLDYAFLISPKYDEALAPGVEW